MKVVIPWIVVFALLVGCFFLYSTTKENEKEIARLHQNDDELTRLRSESVELKQLKVNSEELVRLRNEHEELLRLRGEAGQLRKQAKELMAQLQTAQTLSSQAMQKQNQSTQLANENETLRNQNLQLQQAQAQIRADACIKNLQKLEVAKAVWASEARKPVGTVPTVADLGPYFPNNAFPVCPDGGAYTINAVGTAAACNIVGHVLPKQ